MWESWEVTKTCTKDTSKTGPPKMHFYQLFKSRSEREQNKRYSNWCIKDNAFQTCSFGLSVRKHIKIPPRYWFVYLCTPISNVKNAFCKWYEKCICYFSSFLLHDIMCNNIYTRWLIYTYEYAGSKVHNTPYSPICPHR